MNEKNMRPKFIKEWDPVTPQNVLVYTSEKGLMDADDYTYSLFKRNKVLEEENIWIRETRDWMHEEIEKLRCRVYELEQELEAEKVKNAKLQRRALMPRKPIWEDWAPLLNWFLWNEYDN